MKSLHMSWHQLTLEQLGPPRWKGKWSVVWVRESFINCCCNFNCNVSQLSLCNGIMRCILTWHSLHLITDLPSSQFSCSATPQFPPSRSQSTRASQACCSGWFVVARHPGTCSSFSSSTSNSDICWVIKLSCAASARCLSTC